MEKTWAVKVVETFDSWHFKDLFNVLLDLGECSSETGSAKSCQQSSWVMASCSKTYKYVDAVKYMLHFLWQKPLLKLQFGECVYVGYFWQRVDYKIIMKQSFILAQRLCSILSRRLSCSRKYLNKNIPQCLFNIFEFSLMKQHGF